MRKTLIVIIALFFLAGCTMQVQYPTDASTSTITTTYREDGISAPEWLLLERQREIDQVWREQYPERYRGWYTEGDLYTLSGLRYYGSFNGYDVLYAPAVEDGEKEAYFCYKEGKLWALTHLSADGMIGLENYYRVLQKHRTCEERIDHALLDEKSEIHAPASFVRELRVEIEAAWQAMGQVKPNWYTEEKPTNDRYYGQFEDIHVLLFSGNLTNISRITIGNEDFQMGNSFNLYAYRDGQLLELSRAYEQGLLSDQSLESIAQCHRKLEERLHPDGVGYMTKYKKQDIADAWRSLTGQPLGPWHDELEPHYITGVRYYGTYNQYDVLFVDDASAPASCSAAGYTFDCNGGFWLYVHKDGYLYALDTAYENGWLTEENIVYIYAYHSWFEQEVCIR